MDPLWRDGLCVVGGLFALFTALLGLFRFDYALNRLHAAAIADTLALGLVLLGVMVAVGFRAVLWKLVLVLVSDRANCSSEMMEMMKRDIIEVISRYMDIDAEALDVKITETESDSNNGMIPALVANIPIRDMKHRPDPR